MHKRLGNCGPSRSWVLMAIVVLASSGCERPVQNASPLAASPEAADAAVPPKVAPAELADPVRVLSFYTVAKYDPQADPAKNLAETIRVAQESKKRILLQVDGEWCGWCHKLDKYIAEHSAVADAIGAHFLIMKVNYSDDNTNEAFLKQYPQIPGYPHLYVLESDGTLLHSQNTVELEEGSSYNEAALLAFVERWKSG